MATKAPPPLPHPSSREKVVRKCIPKELIPDTWKCDKPKLEDNLQNLLTEGIQLGMFESGEQLMAYIEAYMNFPKSMEFLNLDPLDSIRPMPYLHMSLTEKPFVYENDLHKIFHYRPFKDWRRDQFGNCTNPISRIQMARSHHQMISYPYIPPANPTQRVLCEPISDILDDAFNTMKGEIEAPNDLAKWDCFIVERMEKLVADGIIDLPPLNQVTVTKEDKKVYRVFSFDGNLVVMEHELEATLTPRGIPAISTITHEEVSERSDFNEMEFVKMDIPQLMFSQTPIPTHYGSFCILAVDVLYELLIDMIVAKKVFHCIDTNGLIWKRVEKFLKAIHSTYLTGIERIYFLDLKDVDAIKKYWEYVYKTHLKSFNAKLYERTKKGRKFPLDKLKEMLKNLNVARCFGEEMMKYADLIYATFPAENDGLSLSDLHLAVTRYQINCVVRKLPKLLEFIHNQKSCKRMNIVECELCFEEMKKKAEAEEKVLEEK